MGPLAGLLMSSLPMRVSLTTSLADMMQTMALQVSRRACRSAKMGVKWSSRNSMVTITTCAWAMSSLQRASFRASAVYSEAEWMWNDKPGMDRTRASRALDAALFKWVSIVTMTTLGR